MSTPLPVVNILSWIEIAYQEQETLEKTAPVEQFLANSIIAYQEQETKFEALPLPLEPSVSGTDVSGGFVWLKAVINVLKFAFLGKAYLYDGSDFTETASPGIYVIYPIPGFSSDTGALIVTGGLKEDGTVVEDFIVYGTENYVISADRDLIAMVVAGNDPVMVYNEKGDVIDFIKGSDTTPLLTGWKLASRSSFLLIYRKI